jgi:hypothetical protein
MNDLSCKIGMITSENGIFGGLSRAKVDPNEYALYPLTQ